MTKERRTETRIEPPTPLEAKVQASFPVRVLDISPRGAQLEVERSLRPNVSCDLRFPLPEGELSVRATVRRCRAWGFGVNARDQKVLVYRAGVEFERPAPDLLSRLRVAVPELPEPERRGPQVSEAAPVESAKASAGVAGATRRGPVKIRISSTHVRKILSALDEE